MKITNAYFAPGFAAFYYDDQLAIKRGAQHDGFTYRGTPATPGFEMVRQKGECISVILEIENGLLAEGDCAAVQYSGAAGRDPLFTADRFLPLLSDRIAPRLIGRDVATFRENAALFDALEIDGARLHTAIRYGLSQALLDATAKATGRLKAEVVCDEYALPLITEPLSLFGQSGDDRYGAVDKMVLKGVDSLPHGLFNNVPDKLGERGEKLEAYVTWLSQRIRALRSSDNYLPTLHIDVYGTVGQVFDNDAVAIGRYLNGLGDLAIPFPLYIEGPADAGSKDGQIALLGKIKAELGKIGSTVKIVADEWCNTYEDVVEFVDARCCDMVQIKTPDLGSIHNSIEAVLYCKSHGVEAYQGGTCNETDLSARACVNIAQATRPDRVLVKPGMGFDEGLTIVANEMMRNLTFLRAARSAEAQRIAV